MRLLGFALFLLLAALVVLAVRGFIIAHRAPSDIPITKVAESDYRSPVEKLEYGDISESFATAIDPAREDEVYSDTYVREDEKADFVQGGIFTPTQEELKHLKMVQDLEAKRNTNNGTTKI